MVGLYHCLGATGEGEYQDGECMVKQSSSCHGNWKGKERKIETGERDRMRDREERRKCRATEGERGENGEIEEEERRGKKRW